MESVSAIRSPRIQHAHGSTNTVGCGTGTSPRPRRHGSSHRRPSTRWSRATTALSNRVRSQLRAVAALDTSGQSARAAYDPDSLIRHSGESVMVGGGAVDSRYERPLVSDPPLRRAATPWHAVHSAACVRSVTRPFGSQRHAREILAGVPTGGFVSSRGAFTGVMGGPVPPADAPPYIPPRARSARRDRHVPRRLGLVAERLARRA